MPREPLAANDASSAPPEISGMIYETGHQYTVSVAKIIARTRIPGL